MSKFDYNIVLCKGLFVYIIANKIICLVNTSTRHIFGGLKQETETDTKTDTILCKITRIFHECEIQNETSCTPD